MKKENIKTTPAKVNNEANAVELRKIVDAHGVSIRNKATDQQFVNKDNTVNKSSKFGVCPSVYYNDKANFKGDFQQIQVVNSYNHKKYVDLIKKVSLLAKQKSNEAVLDFDNDMERIKIISEKNLTIAKVNSLRLLTKAIIIEKDHHEQSYERKCHEETMKTIGLLKIALLEKNDKGLVELLKLLKHDFELELKNNDFDLERAKVKIQTKLEVNLIKREAMRKRINELNEGISKAGPLSSGMPSPKIIEEIKAKRYTPKIVEFDSEVNSFEQLKKQLSTVNVDKLPQNKKEIWTKFIEFVKFNEEEYKYGKKFEETMQELDAMNQHVQALKNRAKAAINNEKVVMVDQPSVQKIINASKKTLTISEPAFLYAAPTTTKSASKKETHKKESNIVIKTKVVETSQPQKISPMVARQPITKIKKSSNDLLQKLDTLTPDFKSMFADDIIQSSVTGLEKFQGSSSSKPTKLKYNTIEYSNYHWEWADAFSSEKKTKATDDYYKNVDYGHTLKESSEFKFQDLNLFSRDAQEARLVKKLQAKIDTLPEDPIIVENKGLFKKENLDVEKIITEFKAIEVTENYTSSEKNTKLLEQVKAILEIYKKLTTSDVEYRKDVQKAQNLDKKLAKVIAKQDKEVAVMHGKALAKHKKATNAISTRYDLSVENAKNKALLNKEYILDQAEEYYAREEQTYLWNSCYHYKTSNIYANDQYKVQNAMITSLVNQIEAFNRKSPEKAISLSSIPGKILPLPINSSARIDISLEKVGNNHYAISTSTDHKKELMSRIVNKDAPENVQKIYVLDKFRAVKDIKTRVALLTEIANIEYVKAIEANDAKVKREIAKAQAILDSKTKEVDKIYDEIELLETAAGSLKQSSTDREWVQQEFEKAKAESWKTFEQGEAILEKQRIAEERAQNLELLKQQKAKDRAEAQNAKLAQSAEPKVATKTVEQEVKPKKGFNLFKTKNSKPDIDEIIGKK
ncbi:MAG: hypothetical protein ACRC4M_03680 [Mycoplasma sp.]